MDTIAITAASVAIAGVVAALLQERFLGTHLDGRAAFVASVIVSLVIGAAAVARVGGVAIAASPSSDPIAFTIEVLKVAAAVLVGAQAAFHVLVKPVAGPVVSPAT